LGKKFEDNFFVSRLKEKLFFDKVDMQVVWTESVFKRLGCLKKKKIIF